MKKRNVWFGVELESDHPVYIAHLAEIRRYPLTFWVSTVKRAG